MKRLFAFLSLAALLLLQACQEEPFLTVSPSTISFSQDGGSQTVQVSANYAWTASVSGSAFKIYPSSGEGSETVTVTVASASSLEAITGSVSFRSEGLSASVTLRQDAKKWVDVTSVSLSQETASVNSGESLKLKATVKPDDASDPSVTWSSDKTDIATVDGSGMVKAIAIGTATITAKAGEKSASCIITVLPSVYDTERAILMALYNATDGKNWTKKDNWGSDNPLNQWYGVTTDEKGRVTGISLNQNKLTGQIPPEIFSLTQLSTLSMAYNNLIGDIPKEVANAEGLTSLSLETNYLNGTIPESLYGMNKLEFISLWGNQLTGKLSEKFWDMPALKHLAIDDNKLTGTLTDAVKNAKGLTWLGLGSNNLTGTIPPEITELKSLAYFSIENHSVSNGSFAENANTISGTIPDDLDKLQNLIYFLAENNNLEGSIPVCFARMPKLKCVEIYGNRLSGEIPAEVVACDNWDVWAPDKNIIPQQKGYALSFSHYESTDFSQDGKVIKLQTHEKGNGISIVITGDMFTDQDIAAGTFETVAKQTMEDFFGVEPFTTFRNLFDVYAVVTVSKSRYSEYGTALDAVFGEGAYVYCDREKVMQYSRKAVSDLDETLTIVIVNKNSDSGTAYMPPYPADTDYGSGFSYACFGLQAEGASRRLLINHEANGHGFTKLQDEYFIRGGSPYPEENKKYIQETFFSKGFYANVDFESDPTKVKWAKFLADERYKDEGLGVFEGGMTFEKGVWRPSENSIMAHQTETGEGSRFNAPSREAAYIRIHKLAYGSSWKYDYEEFVKYDAVNRR